MAELGKLCPQLPRVSLRGGDGCGGAGRPPHISHRAQHSKLLLHISHPSSLLSRAAQIPSSSANPYQPPSAVIWNHHIPRNEQPGCSSPSLSKALLSQCHWET